KTVNDYESAEGIASLLGGTASAPEGFALLQDNWSPGIRLVTGGAGALLLLYALARGGITGICALGLGAALLGRAGTNQPLGRSFAAAAARSSSRQREAA